MPQSLDSLSKFVSVVELQRYIDSLLELTVMAHEISPGGYTAPEMKQFRLGQRASLKRIQSYINR
jgi:hypothetical protein